MTLSRDQPDTASATHRWEMSTLRHVRLVAGESTTGSLWTLVLDGSAEFETAAGRQPLRAGDAALVASRTAYRLTATTEVTDIAVADLRLVVSPRRLPSPLVVPGFRDQHAGVAALVTMCQLRDQCEQLSFATGYGALLGAAMTTSWEAMADRGAGEPDGSVVDVISALVDRPGEPWTLDTMASVGHLSRSALVDRFRRSAGTSPMRALREIRMDTARRLLRDPTRPVTQIALTVGYGSTAAFSRAFSAHHGVAPQEWRSASGAGDPQ